MPKAQTFPLNEWIAQNKDHSEVQEQIKIIKYTVPKSLGHTKEEQQYIRKGTTVVLHHRSTPTYILPLSPKGALSLTFHKKKQHWHAEVLLPWLINARFLYFFTQKEEEKKVRELHIDIPDDTGKILLFCWFLEGSITEALHYEAQIQSKVAVDIF